MKLLNKKDCTNILVLVSIFFIIIFTIVGIKYVNGSTVDWNSQHWVIPEYFRNLYYDTHDIFPSLHLIWVRVKIYIIYLIMAF